MILERIRNSLANKKDMSLHFVYNGSRNQVEEFDGVIEEVYKYVFTIKQDDSEIIKSFSYSDVLIGALIISVK